MRKILLSFFAFLFCLNGLCLGMNLNIPNIAPQGKCIAIQVSSPEGISRIEGQFLGQKFECFRMGDDFKGIVGIPPEQKPGVYELSLIIDKGEGESSLVNNKVKVVKAKFPSVSFWLKPAKKKLLTADLIAQEWARIEKYLVVENLEQGWQGKFMLPAKGPASMAFGTIEYINKKLSGRHRGYDIAVPMGTEVAAPNNGKVVFAEKLKAFGGTMVLDHGQGIHTLYFHLSKFMAGIGQNVSKGDVIALSGNSGISSGPHLHWGISVHNLRVDPVQWTKYAF